MAITAIWLSGTVGGTNVSSETWALTVEDNRPVHVGVLLEPPALAGGG
jgi:hypothetical protein